MKTAIVTTTINVPAALEKYAQNAQFYGHDDLFFVVAGDQKTPPEARAFCEEINANYYPCEYLGPEDQKRYLDRFPALCNHLPFNSVQRRNVALLKAWEEDAEVIITIDDDNLMLNQDFIGLHNVVGQTPELAAIESTSGWFNVCSALEEAQGKPFYHRGYPRGERWKEVEAFNCTSAVRKRVAVNAGLWIDDPDIDAMTRLEGPIVVRGLRPSTPATFVLQPGTWSPFNSQNTAIFRDVIPAYFLSPSIGRYDDIWSSYVVTRIANHLGDVIAYGQPLLRQKRNVHDLWIDLDAERMGMQLTDGFCSSLRNIRLRSATYRECFAELASELPKVWEPAKTWTEAMRKSREGLLAGMEIWRDVFDRLSVGNPGSHSGIARLARNVRGRQQMAEPAMACVP